MEVVLNGKIVGELLGETYITHRKSKEHFYKKGRGYPISNSILKELKEKSVKTIRIVEHNKNSICIYETDLKEYLEAVLIKEGDYDYQRCLPLCKLTKLQIVIKNDE